MKSFLKGSLAFVLMLVFLAVCSFAATPIMFTDPYNVVPTTVTETTDAAVKTSSGYLHDVFASWTGLTAGDSIKIENGAAAGTTALVTIIVPTAAGFVHYRPSTPIPFTTAIYWDITISGGSVAATVQYS